MELDWLLCLSVDNTHTDDASCLRIEDETVNDAELPHRQLTGCLSRGQRRVQAAEVGARDAAASARSAVVAGRAAAMRLRKDRRAADGQSAVGKLLCNHVAHVQLGAVHLHRRKELAIGQLGQILRLAADTDEVLHVVVPGLDIPVADGPVDGDAVLEIALEVYIAPAVALAAPHH